ncbi:TcpQ domain-containing protein [Bordetella petrii]|uniref:TcpQ domain-containing protein n=1 Tax=Bordetella petrii TaxID=94624 RepID=UPI001A974294|nr:TcpQ domain-containing protein [Bordetella petrii]MBO1110726.1 TcpQ domain-containing protein [Bordetella petrii]
MVRFILLGLLPLGLAACAQWPAGAGWAAGGAPAGHYDFNWQLSGDPAVAPLQVFSGAGRTWLQFAPGRTPPALFAQTPAGLQPLSYTRQEPYLIVDGVWPALVLQGGRHMARVERQATPAVPVPPVPSAGSAAGPEAAPAVELPAAPSPPAAPPSAARPGNAPARFRAGPPDATLRAVLTRWADDAGWAFEPQHWAVDADIPLAGSADFPADFKAAVRGLLASTELADRPVQPCFYTNKVLRVVPFTQACDRSAAPGARP